MIKLDDSFKQWLIDVRRTFHTHPELEFQEKKTTDRIKSILKDMGIEHYGYEDMTGVVALIRGKAPGKTLGLRADIDALPIEEKTGLAFASKHPGKMHACGHDAHTAIMLGVARYLKESKAAQTLKGNVKLIFQPAEEGDGGADPMIQRGVLEDPHVDRMLACHVAPDLDTGWAGIHHYQNHASTDPFILTITGKGGHGAHPNQAIDPIVAGAHFVTAVQTIVSRNVDPLEPAVVQIGRFSAGEVGNVIPDQAILAGTLRALNLDTRKIILDRIQQMIKGIEATFNVSCHLQLNKGYPPCTNDPDTTALIEDAAAQELGKDNIRLMRPTTGAEDFAFFAMERPSAMILLGCRNEEKGMIHPLHSSTFNLDEKVLEIGVRVFSRAVQNYLAGPV